MKGERPQTYLHTACHKDVTKWYNITQTYVWLHTRVSLLYSRSMCEAHKRLARFYAFEREQQHWKVIRFSGTAKFLCKCWAISISFSEKTVLGSKALVCKSWGTSCDTEIFIIKSHNVFVSTLSDILPASLSSFPLSRWYGKDSGLCIHCPVSWYLPVVWTIYSPINWRVRKFRETSLGMKRCKTKNNNKTLVKDTN